MTNDEIKRALRTRCLIIHRDPKQQTENVYAFAQAWRVTVNDRWEYVSSLELVKGNSVTIAPADQCEIINREAGT